jgi:hypothetical protein
MKTLFILIFFLVSGYVIAQKGQVSQVNSSFSLKNDKNKKITCKYVSKINAIENDTLSFISIGFMDEFKGGNKGYVYLSNQNELNSFIEDLKLAMSKFSIKEPFQALKPKYKIEIKDVGITYKPSKQHYPEEKICICESIGGNGMAYVSLTSENSNALIKWLESVKF